MEIVKTDTAVSRAYRLGAASSQGTIAAWLRVMAYSRDDRADPDGCAILLEAAEAVETGKYRDDGGTNG